MKASEGPRLSLRAALGAQYPQDPRDRSPQISVCQYGPDDRRALENEWNGNATRGGDKKCI